MGCHGVPCSAERSERLPPMRRPRALPFTTVTALGATPAGWALPDVAARNDFSENGVSTPRAVGPWMEQRSALSDTAEWRAVMSEKPIMALGERLSAW